MITIREIKVKDRKLISRLIEKTADKMKDNSLFEMITSTAKSKSENRTAEAVKVGAEIIKMLLDVVESDMTAWFADLAGVTVDEFEDMPVDTELQIIDQIIQAEESERFFSIASQLSKKIKGFRSMFSGAKN